MGTAKPLNDTAQVGAGVAGVLRLGYHVDPVVQPGAQRPQHNIAARVLRLGIHRAAVSILIPEPAPGILVPAAHLGSEVIEMVGYQSQQIGCVCRKPPA